VPRSELSISRQFRLLQVYWGEFYNWDRQLPLASSRAMGVRYQ
jgi:hypothetical protein